MKQLSSNFSIVVLTLLCAAQAVAEESSRHVGPSGEPTFETPIGFGLLAGRAESQNEYAWVIESENHFKQRRGRYGFRQYGHAESRVEIGNGLGASLSASAGFTLLGLPPAGGWFSPHIGVEPFDGRIAIHTNSAFARYYEWMPMLSAGLQWGLPQSCRFLALVRGGGAAGNLGSSGWAPVIRAAYGIGAELNCNRFDGVAELTRLPGGDPAVNLGTVDFAYTVKPQSGLKVGLRGESDLGRGGSADELTERRFMLILRGQLASWD